MASYAALAKLAGAARGVRKGIDDYYATQATKQSLQQSEEQWNINRKIKELELKQAEMSNALAPERLMYEREKVKLENKVMRATLEAKKFETKEKEIEIINTVQSNLRDAAITKKLLDSNSDSGMFQGFEDLPEGVKITQKLGDNTTIQYTNNPANAVAKGLSPEQVIQGAAFAKKKGGVIGAKELKPAIYTLMREGKTIDEIQDTLRYSGQSDEFAGPMRTAVQSIMINAPENKAQSAMDYVDDLISTGDVEEAKNQIKRLARTQAGTEESRAIGGKERTVKFLDEIQNDLRTLEENGVNTNIFSGTTENMMAKLGTVKNPDMRRVANKIAIAIQNYRRSMSGVAFSVPESAEYKSIFPSISKTKDFNFANISSLRNVLKGDLESFYSLAIGDKTYKQLFKSGFDYEAARAAGATEEEIKAYLGDDYVEDYR